ncbi:hypothetical protein [Azospira sp. I09]|uniref:hypothetical protein n=1 Tax=Azospira sp. I09 TaxID=1765049 RepID=UPI0012611A09|nr:hypothetical protein [Azospira sp. I09]BBN90594.1 hypothetical protein AZSP09_36170 [Azospira sp. I09]
MVKHGYRMVCGLWVFPDFSEVEAGRREPPRVNHDKVDFKALALRLSEVFGYGPPTVLSVTNDTIDQVTIHSRLAIIRMPQHRNGDPTCRDFGQAALQVSPSQLEANGVINVRQVWRPLHCLQDRSFSPPPTVIAFLAQSSDFEDAMAWFGQCQMVLGLDLIERMLSDAPDSEDDQVGVLPSALQSALSDIFGCPFEDRAILSRLAEDTPPSYVMNARR